MNNFTYYAPTKVIFGRDAELEVGKEIASRGGHKVLVHYGDTFLQENGILDKVHKSLTDAGLEYVDLDGVVPNPRLSLVRKGIELCKKEGVDFILPIGGGSATDSAKAIAYGIANDDFDILDLVLDLSTHKIPKEKVKIAPLGCIITIAATGSEMSNAMVITIDEDHVKRTYLNDIGRPLFAILDPVITFTLPKYQIACGAADIMMHTMERYFHNVEGTDLVDHIAEGLLVSVKEAALVAMKEPTNYDARATLMWAGSMSHNGLTGCGRMADWGPHKLQAEMGGMFDMTHGAGLCAVWGSWARYCMSTNPARFAKFAVRVMGVSEDFSDIEGTALKGIEAFEEWCHKIGMPTSMSEMNIHPTPEQIDEMAQKCADSNGVGYVAFFKRLYKEDIKAIYEMAL
ncbi:MAG: iron-containing alcohol dehydrogenase [Lachnospiraceae bacterium]|nr:iron-containing alcohol dehydrogenase [Lachnospiraceae bacterium]